MLVSIPRVIILAGMAEPGWLMLGFVLIAVPAAGHGLAGEKQPKERVDEYPQIRSSTWKDSQGLSLPPSVWKR